MSKIEKKCRFCKARLRYTFADLGVSPLANSYLKPQDLQQMEPFYPLHAFVCGECFLVQLEEFGTPQEIFSDYAYFSSYSGSWLEHARVYAGQAIERFALRPGSLVVEIGSNDGYLLQYFKSAGIDVLGIDPAANVARAAREKGIPTLVDFFGGKVAGELAARGKQADLIVGNNVLAHIPDTHDLLSGLKALLKPGGAVTMEFPHLLRLMEENQFDTIYHEHYSYFSFMTANTVFASHGLTLFDVEELPTHGGSLRIYAGHAGDTGKPAGPRVKELLEREERLGFKKVETYLSFGEQVKKAKREILQFMIEAKREGKSIAGYGAPAKGNTLLNYCGIRTDFLDYTVDKNPHKQGLYLPGTRIPIAPPEKIRETRPDYLLILPWNLKNEIMAEMIGIKKWGGKFVIPIPKVEVI
jgi:SAM-dependent methyltransferase